MLNGTSAEFIDEDPSHDYSLYKRMGQRHLKGTKVDKNGKRLEHVAESKAPQAQSEEIVTLKRQDEKEKYHHDGRQGSYHHHHTKRDQSRHQAYTPGFNKHKKAEPAPPFNLQVAQIAFVPVVVESFRNSFNFKF